MVKRSVYNGAGKNNDYNHKFALLLATMGFIFVLGGLFLMSNNNFGITGNVVSGFFDGLKALFDTSALTGTSIARSFSTSEYTAGTPFTVKLTVTTSASDKIINYGIEENVPAGWTITNVNASDFYSISGQKISWIVNSSNKTTYLASKELSYTATPGSADSGSKAFTSTVIFTSMSSASPVSESASMSGSTSISTPGSTNPSANNPSSGGGGGGGGKKPTTITNSTTNATVLDTETGEIITPETDDNTETIDETSTDTPSDETANIATLPYVIAVAILLIAIVIVTLIIVKKKNSQELDLTRASQNTI